MPVGVLLVDQQPFFCEAVQAALPEIADVDVVGWTTDELEADRMVTTLGPQVVLTETLLSAGSGLSLARRLRGRARVILLTRRPEGEILLDAVDAGAMGCVSHDVGLARLGELVLTGASGRFALDPDRLHDALLRVRSATAGDDASGGRLARLTGREREVLGLIAAGLDDRTIASELYLSAKTVRTHVGNIMKKLDVHTRADAARMALVSGASEPAAHILRIEGPELEMR